MSFQEEIDIILEVFDGNFLSIKVDFDALNRSSHIESTSEKINKNIWIYAYDFEGYRRFLARCPLEGQAKFLEPRSVISLWVSII